MLTDLEIIKKYGQPGDEKNLVVIKFPYPMRIAWDLTKSVTSTRCHKLAAPQFQAVFGELLAAYGLPELQRLGIDLFGGLVNFRLQRGSKTKWSRHSWGIAIDLDPVRNGLKTKWKDAQFSKHEYKKMIDIFYKNGFMSYGKDRDFDAMHLEISS